MAQKQKLTEDYLEDYHPKQDTDLLVNLINHLQIAIQNKSSTLAKIKNPSGLLNSLTKLNNMVGLKYIKQSIAKQTTFLITKLEQGDFSMKMLNTVLMGGAGHGKTQIGIVLAEIWHHLGFLKYNVSDDTLLTILSYYDRELLKIYAVFLFIILSQVYHSFIKPMHEKFGAQTLVCVFVALIVLLYLFYQNKEQLFPVLKKDSNYITITSRSDFVGSYLGTSDKKTEDLLRNNIGKVVFIDEAYSLVSGYQDMYGMEALTSLNKFLSEHENQIVVIFAGYEDALQNTIFKAQKGLARRCMWHFKIDNYSVEELFDIFQLQLKKEQLSLLKKDYFKIHDFFLQNENAFPYAGGDVEKLVFFCQLNKNSRLDYSNSITYDDVKVGMKELVTNNQKPKENSQLEDYLKKLI